MSIRKFWHITLSHTGSAKMFHLSLSRATNIYLLAVTLFLFAGLGFTFHYIHGKKTEIAHLKSLRQQNRAFRSQLTAITRDIDTLQVQIDLVAEGEESIRKQNDLPLVDEQIRSMGIGGMAIDTDVDAFDSELNAQWRSVREKTDQLSRVSGYCLNSHKDLRLNMKMREQINSYTPSIYPTFGRLASGFGGRSDPFTHRYAFHQGLDIDNVSGAPIYATADGFITKSGYANGYGNLIEISHKYGYTTRYGHLQQSLVSIGQEVKKGQLIGLMGSTGRSTGSHLHYEVLLYGLHRNPKGYLKPMNDYGITTAERKDAIRLGYLTGD
jgi:murein DD-endopeptidase MepM/ murein hydrolase activator NlpD